MDAPAIELTLDTVLAKAESDIARINAPAQSVTFDDPDDEDEDDDEPVTAEKGDDD